MEFPATASGYAASAFFTDPLESSDPEIFASIRSELGWQRFEIEPAMGGFSYHTGLDAPHPTL
jgi:hypothetical protein